MKSADARSVRSRVVIAVAVIALAGATALAGVAIAHNRVYSNQVTFKRAGIGGKHTGRVNSGNARCERNREVQVWHANPNPDVRLGTTYTNAFGRWTLVGPPRPAGQKVYALIETKVLLSNQAHDHTCPVDRSPVRTIPYP